MDARHVVQVAMAAWSGGDDKAFWRLLAPDVEYSVIGSTPVSGTHHGRQAFFDEALLPMGALLAEGARPVDVDIIAEGGRVVVMWRGVGTMLNGAPYNNSYCWVLDVEDGLVIRVKAYLDTELVSALFHQTPTAPE